MKIFTITHDTRCEGAGSLNGLSFKDFCSARAKVDDWIDDYYNPSYIEKFWNSPTEFWGEEDMIEIVEKELE